MANSKWADFCISAVQYDKQRKHIVAARVHADKGETLGEAITYPRTTIVDHIERNHSYITVTKDKEGKWVKGQPVFVVLIKTVKYIKTVDNEKESDNLENLPEF